MWIIFSASYSRILCKLLLKKPMWNSFTYPNKIKTSGLNLLPGTISRCQNDLLDEGIVHILGKVG